ncbi:MAG: translocation/assembly module TamB domain-containing protein [Gammaproteobacteria bacterium]|nr:translocation/assembly module TamB domain-containing protein [Gammaproteobacteria bacterium]
MKRLLLWLAGGVIVIVTTVVLVAIFLFASPAGSAWLVQRAAPLVPGDLSLQDVDGTLAAGLEVGRLRYAADGWHLDANTVLVRVDWPLLATDTLGIQELVAESIIVRLLPGDESPAEDQPLPEVSLPIGIVVQSADVQRFQLTSDGFDESVTAIRLAAAWRDTQFTVSQLKASARGVVVQITGALGFVDAWPLDAEIDWQLLDQGLAGSGTVRGDLDRLTVSQRVELPDVVQIDGAVTDLLNSPRVDLRAAWDRLALPVTDAPGAIATAHDGRLTLAGDLNEYRATLHTDLDSAIWTTIELQVDGSGDVAGLQFNGSATDSSGATLTAIGGLAYEDLAVNVDVQAVAVPLQQVSPQLVGQVDFRARVNGNLPDHLAVSLDSLDGELFGEKVAGVGRARLSGEQLTIAGLSVESGPNSVSFDGSVMPNLTGQLDVDAPALNLLVRGLTGSLIATGSIVDDSLSADLEVEDLGLNDQLIGDLAVRAGGSLTAHRLEVVLTGGPIGFNLTSSGAWSEGRLQHDVTDGEVDVGPAGQWLLDRLVTVAIGQDEVEVAGHCWRNDPSTLCFDDFTLANEQFVAGGRLAGLPLELLQPLVGGELTVAGRANADFRLQRSGEQLEARLRWQQIDTRLTHAAGTPEELATRIQTVLITAQGDQDGLAIDGQVAADYGVSGSVSGEIREPLSSDPQLDLQLVAALPDLAAPMPLVARYLPVQNLRGSARADLAIRGSWRRPEIFGQVLVTDAHALLPAAGIELQNIRVELSGQGAEPVAISGSAESGGGEMRVTGELDWSEDTGIYADLQVSGNEFQAIRYPDQVIYISPELQAHIDAGKITVTGSVNIPRADIKLDELPAGASSPSQDAVVHRSDAELQTAAPTQLQLVGAVEVSLGDSVRFEGFGLETWLEGSLTLTQPPGSAPPTAQGQLQTVDARFKAAGKELAVERGVLIFSGPLERPRLDIRASRRIDYEGREITAGVLIAGPADDIETKVFARPAMSEADALSFLVLDRPASVAQADSSGELSESAIALGLVKVLPITQELEKGLGLDEIALEGSGGDNTAMVLGKRISSDLFIRYKYGLFNRIGTFLVRYRIWRGFSIEAGTGQQQSLDLIYTIDR